MRKVLSGSAEKTGYTLYPELSEAPFIAGRGRPLVLDVDSNLTLD